MCDMMSGLFGLGSSSFTGGTATPPPSVVAAKKTPAPEPKPKQELSSLSPNKDENDLRRKKSALPLQAGTPLAPQSTVLG